MSNIVEEHIKKAHAKRRKRNIFVTIALSLSLLVIVGVNWGLRGTGVSYNEICNKEAHVHGDGCYSDTYICGQEEGVNWHVHTNKCKLTCTKKAHVHSTDCLGPINQGGITSPKIVNKSIAQADGTEKQYEYLLLEDGSYRELNEFYVDTALGERHKDKINEYLRIYPVDLIEDNYPHMVDGEYIKNFFGGAGRTISAPYKLISGSSNNKVDLVLYTNDWDPNELLAYRYDNGVWNLNNSSSWANPLVSIVDKDNIVPEEIHTDNGIVYRVAFSVETSEVVGWNVFSKVSYKEQDFFISSVSDTELDHADIEISDGGSFVVKTIRRYQNSPQIDEIVVRYSSYVAAVNGCKLYGWDVISDPSDSEYNKTENHYQLMNTYWSDDYHEKTADSMGGQATQVEWTSQGNDVAGHPENHKRYSYKDLSTAIFNIDINLKPEEIISAVRYEDAGHYEDKTGGTNISNTVQLGDAIEITGFDYALQGKSIVDAFNKCPNHTGLDFNIIDTQMEVVVSPPAAVDFNALKLLDSQTNVGNGAFRFDLYSVTKNENGETVEKLLERAYNTADGKVAFNSLTFSTPGVYKYKIKEYIPSQANAENYYKYNGIQYDTSVYEIEVAAELDSSFYERYYAQYGKGGSVVLNQDMLTTITVKKDGTPIHTDTVTNPSDYPYVFDLSDPNKVQLQFKNTTYDYIKKDIVVNKVFSDGNSNHSGESIFFEVYQLTGSETPSNGNKVFVNGVSVFELNSSNNWSVTVDNLFTKIGDIEYRYEVRELNPGKYTPSYSYDNSSASQYKATITNVKNTEVKIDIKKEWDVPAGTTLPEVSINLMRRYKDNLVPIKVVIKEKETGTVMDTALTYGYRAESDGYTVIGVNVGGLVSSGDAEHPYANYTATGKNCLASLGDSQNGNANFEVRISNITPGAEVTVECPKASDVILVHETKRDDFSDWKVFTSGTHLDPCSWTFYSGDGNGGTQAIGQSQRTAAWNRIQIPVDTHLEAGKTYSIGAYAEWRIVNNQTIISPIVGLDLSMTYKDTSGKDRYVGIASIADAKRNTFYHLQNMNFTVPSDYASGMLIYLQTQEVGPEYVDIVLDDLVIAEAGNDIVVDRNGVATRNIKFTPPWIATPSDDKIWHEDTSFNNSHSFKLNGSESWKKTFTAVDLAEDPYREYEYYIAEDTTGMQAYRVEYSNNDGVATTTDTPITVKNTYVAYVLPSTGGIGAEKLRLIGLMTLAGGTFILLLTRMHKRKKISQTK